MTTRKALLDLATQYSKANAVTLALANQIGSAEEAEAAAQKLRPLLAKEVVLENRIVNVGLVGLAVALVTFAYGVMAESATSCLVCVGLVLLLFGLVSWGGRRATRIGQYKTQLSGLAPIADTGKCLQALQYIERAHPPVMAWRDFAIADRGQLYGFDVSIMAYLHHQAEAQVSKTESQKRVQDACRKVHGIAPASA